MTVIERTLIYVNTFTECWTNPLVSVTVVVDPKAQTTNLEEKGRLTGPAKFRSKGKDLEYLFPFAGIFFSCNFRVFFSSIHTKHYYPLNHVCGFSHIRQHPALISFHP